LQNYLQSINERKLTYREKKYQRFWKQFKELDAGRIFSSRTTEDTIQSFVSIGGGSANFSINLGLAARYITLNYLTYFPTKEEALRVFATLRRMKKQIERDFGDTLVWDEMPNSDTSCQITYVLDIDDWMENENIWPELQEGMIITVLRFRGAILPQIKSLIL
jgi:hypothetical protein